MHSTGAVLIAQPTTAADEELWSKAIDIAWAGNGSNAAEVAATLSNLIRKRSFRTGHDKAGQHPAIQAITEHLLFLEGVGGGVSGDRMTQLAQHVYRTLGTI